MLRAVMAKIMQGFVFVAPAADINALGFSALGGQKPGRLDFGAARPMGGAVDAFVALGAPAVHGQKRHHAKPQGGGKRRRGGAEELGRQGRIFLLPDKPLPGQIEMAHKRGAQGRVIGEFGGDVLGGGCVQREKAQGQKDQEGSGLGFGLWRAKRAHARALVSILPARFKVRTAPFGRAWTLAASSGAAGLASMTSPLRKSRI